MAEVRGRDWRDEVIYQLLVDRFANGDPRNDPRGGLGGEASLARYQGGDWQGVIDRLDYIQALGATAIWISPVVQNVETDVGADGYHGYWPSDLAEPNAHFGDLATLRRLVRECHRRGLRVLLDIVVNHMGQLFYYDANRNGRPDPAVPVAGGESFNEYDPPFEPTGPVAALAPPAGPAPVVFLAMPEVFRAAPGHDRADNRWQAVLASPEGYHRRGRIVRFDVEDQVLRGDFPGGLKDVATERDDVRRAMVEAWSRWVERAGFDGFRIDSAKHVEHEFFRAFAPAVRARLAAAGRAGFFMVGEVLDGDDARVGAYTRPGELDAVFDFPTTFALFRALFHCGGATDAAEARLAARARHYGARPQPGGAGAPPAALLVNALDNHDMPRFLAGAVGDDEAARCPGGRVADAADLARMRRALHAALALLFTWDGIPCVYYGTERDLRGGHDPANREVLWRAPGEPYDTAGATFRRIARLAALRRAYRALRRGALRLRWTTAHTGAEQDAGVLAFERVEGDARALVVVNARRDGASETAAGGGAMATGFAPGTELVDVLADARPLRVRVGAAGRLVVRVEPLSALVLVPADRVAPLPAPPPARR